MWLRGKWVWAAAVLIGILLISGWLVVSPRLTRYVESDTFREKLEEETAKGLHFKKGRYAPIRRTGALTAASDGFDGSDGRKAMRSLKAHGITARFNPWGVFLRRWQLDDVHIASGEVAIQVYEPKPEPSPAKPWFAIFLPDRVYLRHVESEPVDVTWQFREKRAGFFGTRLLITPYGRDFNYQATGGTLRMPSLPELTLQQTDLRITKTLLSLYDLDLATEGKESGTIRVKGEAGTREDKSVDFQFRFDRIEFGPWLPQSWQQYCRGLTTGSVHWKGKDTKLEHSSGEAEIRVADAEVDGLSFLEQIATVTKKKDLSHLRLSACSARLDWKYPTMNWRDLVLEEKGKFSLRGRLTVEPNALNGTFELGMAPAYLDWLPNPEQVFSRKEGGYLWTTFHLSGDPKHPKQDLSPRIMEAFKDSPGASLDLFFRLIGAWLQGKAGSSGP